MQKLLNHPNPIFMKLEKNYNCSQAELYAVCNLGWQNYKLKLTGFANHKAKYTMAFGDAAIAEVLAAKNLPDYITRAAVPESTRIQMQELAAKCLANWQALKSYIRDAFKESQYKPMLESAGSKHYRRASNGGWDGLQSLVTAAALFITNNTVALSKEGENMPEAFPDQFTADKEAFENTYATYLLDSQGSVTGTSEKNIANNAIAAALAKMFADGQIIFKDDPATKEMFVFEALLQFVTKPGESGLRIVAIESVTELPIEGLQVIAQPGNVIGTTDENGVLILSLPENSYSIIGMKDGYNSFNEEVNITTGVVSRKNVELTKTA